MINKLDRCFSFPSPPGGEGRVRGFLLFTMATVLLSSCGSHRVNPNILTTEKYNKVQYTVSVPNDAAELGQVKVSKRAGQASIRYTIPALYEKAIMLSGQYIADISLKTTAKKELFDVPYKKCKQVQKQESVRKCTTVSKQVSEHKCEYFRGEHKCGPKLVYKPVEECKTEYVTKRVEECERFTKQELRWVLYQTATGMVYGNKAE
ncbi:hypothetical protein ACFL6Y_10080 [Elusimicrobiota bacterium]